MSPIRILLSTFTKSRYFVAFLELLDSEHFLDRKVRTG